MSSFVVIVFALIAMNQFKQICDKRNMPSKQRIITGVAIAIMLSAFVEAYVYWQVRIGAREGQDLLQAALVALSLMVSIPLYLILGGESSLPEVWERVVSSKKASLDSNAKDSRNRGVK